MDTFLWWSGVAFWAALSLAGLIAAADWAIEQLIRSFKLQRDFLAFVWDRVRKASDRIPAG